MAEQVTLAISLPGVPKGTILTQDAEGRFRSDTGFWIDAQAVEDANGVYLPGAVVPEDIPNEVIIYVAQGDGSVTKIPTGSALPPTGKLPPNAFLDQMDAEVLAAKYRAILGISAVGAVEAAADGA